MAATALWAWAPAACWCLGCAVTRAAAHDQLAEREPSVDRARIGRAVQNEIEGIDEGGDLRGARLATVGQLDAAYGGLAGLIVIVGVARVIWGDAGWQFYGTFNWLAIVSMFSLGLLAYFAGSVFGLRMSAK